MSSSEGTTYQPVSLSLPFSSSFLLLPRAFNSLQPSRIWGSLMMSWEWCRQINAPPDPYRDDGAAPKSGGSDTPNPRRNLGRSKACAGICNMQHRACSMDVQISCQQINFRSGKAFTFIISSSPSLLVRLFPLSPSILLTPCSKAFFFFERHLMFQSLLMCSSDH